ncbi:MAG: hypothetical protein J2P54_06660 [Bradyrhizobiaceae bacterium]|nr:hypothetical protein [Bradyrhizobiaceae bacterium]
MPNAAAGHRSAPSRTRRIISSKEFVDKFEALGFEILTSTPEELAAFAAADTADWGAIIKAINVRLD